MEEEEEQVVVVVVECREEVGLCLSLESVVIGRNITAPLQEEAMPSPPSVHE